MVFDNSIFNKIPILNLKLQSKFKEKSLIQSKNSTSLFDNKNPGLNNLPFKQNFIQENFHEINNKNLLQPKKPSIFENLFKTKPVNSQPQINPVNSKSLLEKTCDIRNIAQSLIKIIDIRDSYTGIHSQAVQKYSEAFARQLNLSKHQYEIISIGSSFHDIGKIGIPESILNSKSELNDKDFEIIKQHPEIGDKILV